VIFAIGEMPFAIGFMPGRIVVDRSEVRPEPWQALLGLIGPPFEADYDVRLTLEDAGGLDFEVFPFGALEATVGFPDTVIEPIDTGQWVFLDIVVDGATPLGEHLLVVRGDGPAGTDAQRAVLVVEVTDRAGTETEAPSGPVSPGAPSVPTPRPGRG
jgi:hypothetical protein